MQWFTRLTRLGPLAKIVVWLVATVLLAAAIQVLAWAVGIDFSILNKQGGSGILIGLAMFLLLMLVAADNRPMSEFGLVADRHWLRHGGTGFAAGAAVYGLYCLVVCAAGVLVLQPGEMTPYRGAKALLAVLTAPIIGVTQQIIFAGFLLGMLRERHRAAVAVAVPAGLFGAACCLTKLEQSTLGELAPLAMGMFLVALLLGLLRLHMGSITLPAGVLAGAVAVRKAIGKSHVVAYEGQAPLADWLAPGGDPRQAPAFWLVILLAILAAAYVLARFGPRKPSGGTAGVDASFKTVMPFSNLLGLAPLDRWLVQLGDAGFRVGPKYIPRLMVTLIASTFNTVLSLPERLLAPWLIRHDVPPPVFLVGMSRSGTTHLHNLLALDPQFRAPRNYEVFNPHGFLTGWLTTAVLAPFLSWRRPMDAVQMQVFSPQEEEFALAEMTSESPYWSFVFPRRIAANDRYWTACGWQPAAARRWEQQYRLFLRKLTCWRRRRPLLKNPANTGRVAWLARLFPQAQFVHIVRHPHAVYRSNVHLARHGLVVFQLQDPDPDDSYETRIVPRYRKLIDTFYGDTAGIPASNVAEVRFEDLEAHPTAAIERLYAQLGLAISPEYRQRLAGYLQRVAGYRKNRFAQLSDDERRLVNETLAPYLDRWGYGRDGSVLPGDLPHAA